MAERLARESARAGLPAGPIQRLSETVSTVAETRAFRTGDREHFTVLHTARTALILIEDCGVRDAELLIAAAALDTVEPELMPEPEWLPLEPGELELLRDTRAAVDSEFAIEELLVASDAIRLLAISEALDHARHLHLRQREAWPAFHETARAFFLPIAGRTHEALARRFQWWCDMFEQRYLRT